MVNSTGSRAACPKWPRRPSTVLFSRFARSALISTTAAAPSLIDDELAAVTVPSFLKAGLREAIFSGRASLGPSSSSTTVLLPFLSTSSTGAISALNAPSFCARCARWVLSRAYSSCALRENWKSAAHFSPHMPMCMSL